MEEIKTKCGTLYIKKTDEGYQLLDSLKRVLIWDSPRPHIDYHVGAIKLCDEIGEWLHNFDDVCWGTKKQIIEYTKGYVENDDVKFDKKWFESEYNKVGNTYILFEYSDCWVER